MRKPEEARSKNRAENSAHCWPSMQQAMGSVPTMALHSCKSSTLTVAFALLALQPISHNRGLSQSDPPICPVGL